MRQFSPLPPHTFRRTKTATYPIYVLLYPIYVLLYPIYVLLYPIYVLSHTFRRTKTATRIPTDTMMRPSHTPTTAPLLLRAVGMTSCDTHPYVSSDIPYTSSYIPYTSYEAVGMTSCDTHYIEISIYLSVCLYIYIENIMKVVYTTCVIFSE